MSRGARVRFFLVLGLLGGCLALAINVKPNLGLDLRGGAQFVFQAEGTEQTPGQRGERRQDPRGAARSRRRPRCRRVHAGPPGRGPDPGRAARRHQRRGGAGGRGADRQDRQADRARGRRDRRRPTPKPSKKGNQILPSDQGDTLEIGPTVLQGDDITGADAVQRDQSVGWVVAIDFSGKGGDTWADITGKAACNPSGDPKRRIAIVLDGKIISSPEVNTGVGCDVGIRGGSTDITGNFTAGRGQGPRRADRGRLAAARAEADLRPARRPDAR